MSLTVHQTMDPDSLDVIRLPVDSRVAMLQRHAYREPRIVFLGEHQSFTLIEVEQMVTELAEFVTAGIKARRGK